MCNLVAQSSALFCGTMSNLEVHGQRIPQSLRRRSRREPDNAMQQLSRSGARVLIFRRSDFPHRAASRQGSSLRLHRVNDVYKRKAVEVGIPSTHPPDAVLAHENGGMRVMEQVACQMRKLPDNLRGHVGVPRRGYQDADPGRGEQRPDEVPCGRRIPWASHYVWVSRDPQELLQNRPSRVPSIRTHSLAFQPVSACRINGESWSAAYTNTLASTTSITALS